MDHPLERFVAVIEAPTCSHRPPCPGCPRFGMPGLAPAIRREIEALALESGADLEILDSPAAGFRHRARLVVRGRPSSPKIGIYQQGSHRPVDIPRCPVHHPLINEAAQVLRRVIARYDLQPYHETAGKGLLRYVQFAIGRPGHRVQIVLVSNSDDPEPLRGPAASLADELGDSLDSVHWNGNRSRNNEILGPTFETLRGEDFLEESVAGARIHLHPGAFGQANPVLFDSLVQRIRAAIPDASRVVEYHAGAGGIGLGLLDRVESVVFNEISPHALLGLERALCAGIGGRASIARGAAEDHLDLLSKADGVIADPPRKGLGDRFLDAILDSPPSRLALLHCGFEAFRREVARLLASKRFRLDSVTAAEMFPYTEQVEMLTLWSRT